MSALTLCTRDLGKVYVEGTFWIDAASMISWALHGFGDWISVSAGIIKKRPLSPVKHFEQKARLAAGCCSICSCSSAFRHTASTSLQRVIHLSIIKPGQDSDDIESGVSDQLANIEPVQQSSNVL